MTIQESTLPSVNKNGITMSGMQLQARDLEILAPGGIHRISGVSLHVEPHELVAVTGSGRLGKSLLLEALAGIKPPSKGDILLDGVDLYKYRKVYPSYIGFVPPEISLPENLRVLEILNDEARLRLPRDIPQKARQQRVDEVLELVGLQAETRAYLRSLSSYKRWVTSIAVELLNHPGLLLISEPVLALDPAEEIKVTTLLKQLTKQGLTVVQATDVSRCALMANKVLVLAPDGTLAWFGPAGDALTYFSDLLQEEGILEEVFSYDDLLITLENPQLSKAEPWSKRFRSQPAYTTYVDDPLNDKRPDLLLQDRPLSRFRGASKEKTPPPRQSSASGLVKFNLLAKRAIRLLARERAGVFMLLAPPVVALTDLLLSTPWMSDPLLGDPGRPPVALGLLVFLEMILAALLFHNEITKERVVYQRESRTTRLTFPYILSKTWVAFLLAIYIGLCWTIIHFIAAGLFNRFEYFPATWITLILAAFIGGILGLIASAIARHAHTAVMWVLILIIPQLILSGSILPLPRLSPLAMLITQPNPARHIFETLLTLSDYGQDIAADACWQLSDEERSKLTDEQKQNCICLGDNIFSQCRFPGIHKFFTFVIEQPKPNPPPADNELNNFPVQPPLRQGMTPEEYKKLVDEYTSEVEQYQNRLSTYSSNFQKYMENLTNWQRTRSLVIGNAEGVIGLALSEYGHGLQVDPIQKWLILIGMSLVLIFALFGIQSRRGSVI